MKLIKTILILLIIFISLFNYYCVMALPLQYPETEDISIDPDIGLPNTIYGFVKKYNISSTTFSSIDSVEKYILDPKNKLPEYNDSYENLFKKYFSTDANYKHYLADQIRAQTIDQSVFNDTIATEELLSYCFSYYTMALDDVRQLSHNKDHSDFHVNKIRAILKGYYLGYKYSTISSSKGETDQILDENGGSFTKEDFDKVYEEYLNAEEGSTLKEEKRNSLEIIYEELKKNPDISEEDKKEMADILHRAENESIMDNANIIYNYLTPDIKYYNPLFDSSSASTAQEHSPDDIISTGDKIVSDGLKNPANLATISELSLQNVSNTIYNILLILGIVIVIIWGTFLAVKFMTASVDEKADVKSSLWPFFVGSIVIFTAFGIWKIILLILANM